MTGVFTDNQPDFTWFAPYEEKVFVQNFLPYSELGMVQNANTQLALEAGSRVWATAAAYMPLLR